MENQNIEYKESWRDEYLKWICGFANAQGGKLYIGIKDNGDICGVENAHKLSEDIPNKVRDVFGIIVDVNLHEHEGKSYIEICVDASSYPVSYKGEYHIRSGSTKQQLQGIALTQFLLKKTGLKWDSIPVDNITFDDLDPLIFKIFRREALRNKRMTEEDLNCTDNELLERLNLYSNGKLKRAAVLLFHPNPEKMITGCFTKIAMFENDADILYVDEVHGSLIHQADTVLELLYLKYLKAYITYENVTRVETYPFPKLAVREALFNALIHSDWSASNPIQICVYEDKLYISNNCILEDGWTAETLMAKHRSIPHNPDIAKTFYRAGYIEAWGRGIEKICRICKEYGSPMPVYDARPHDIMLRFDALEIVTEKVTEKVTENQQKILDEIKTNPYVTQEELSVIIGISKRHIVNNMNKLQALNIIKRVGPDNGGHWEKLKNK